MSTSTLVATSHLIRPELGDFSSVVCFKAIVTGIEEALGEKAAAIALIAAGRARGKQLATSLELEDQPLSQLAIVLNQALGLNGTRLCIIDKIVEADELIKVYCRETICSLSEPQGSNRQLTYTLGAVQGVLEHVTGKRLRGKQVESILRGSNHDVIAFQTL